MNANYEKAKYFYKISGNEYALKNLEFIQQEEKESKSKSIVPKGKLNLLNQVKAPPP